MPLRTIGYHRFCLVFICLALGILAGVQDSSARTVVWAGARDVATLDPHRVDEATPNPLVQQIYDPLILRDPHGKLQPGLAAHWRIADNPHQWILTLRADVTFHDGTPLTVEDVIFSLERARHPNSGLHTRLNNISRITKGEPRSILIETKGHDPLLPIRLTDAFIMSRSWVAKHGVEIPGTSATGKPGFPTTAANGTGAFRLDQRTPGTETTLTANTAYWDGTPAVDAIVYRVIPDLSARIDAMVAGKVDFLQNIAADSLAPLVADPGIRIKRGPENRVIVLGLNVTPQARVVSADKAEPDTATEAPKANPLADQRVRHAIDLLIDRARLQREVMGGQSIPTGVVAPPTINGYPQRFDRVRPPDLEQARRLLAQAGYVTGFNATLDCPSGRYTNDTEICRAVADMLKPLGITIAVKIHPVSDHFTRVRTGQSDMFLTGWSVPTLDSEYIFRHFFRSQREGEQTWNGTGFSNAHIDALIDKLAEETDRIARNATIADIWWRVHFERVYIPLHVQILTYAMRKDLDIPVDMTSTPRFRFARVVPATPVTDEKQSP